MDDLISRQAAIKAIAEFLYYPNNWDGMRAGFDLADWEWKIKGVLSDVPSAQPTDRNGQERTGTDLISRQAAIDALSCLDDYEEQEIETLRKLPSAQTQRKKGKWIPKDDGRYHCSLCNGIAPKGYRWDYCPHCGAPTEAEEQE